MCPDVVKGSGAFQVQEDMEKKQSKDDEAVSKTVAVDPQEPRDKIVLKLVRNVKRSDSKTVVVGGAANSGSFPTILSEVQQVAANKMRISLASLKLFNHRGEELSISDQKHAEEQIRNGNTLYVSAGEPSVMDKNSEQKQGSLDAETDVIVLAKESLVDAQAIKQLKWAAALPGVVLGVGLPDLHVGASCPIGAAIATEDIVYPTLVGSDIGCGMLLAKTSLRASAGRKSRYVDRWAANLQLEGSWSGNTAGALADAGVEATPFDQNSLGTIGRGNHFAELQVVDSVEDAELAQKLGLSNEDTYLCVHSGSRGLGESILKAHTAKFGAGGLSVQTKEAREYLAAHDQACKWAQVNRRVIATRLLDQLDANMTQILLDITHNSVVEVHPLPAQVISDECSSGKSLWLHRKGAAPSDKGPVVIPGSRGTISYIVQPVDEVKFASSGYSLAHGAGRAIARSAARAGGKLRHQYANDLTTTALGSRVVCDDKALLHEERPEAYKDVSCVVADLVSANLCKVVALMRPVLTYKMRSWQGINKAMFRQDSGKG